MTKVVPLGNKPVRIEVNSPDCGHGKAPWEQCDICKPGMTKQDELEAMPKALLLELSAKVTGPLAVKMRGQRNTLASKYEQARNKIIRLEEALFDARGGCETLHIRAETARADGFRAGIEAAAKVCEQSDNFSTQVWGARNIRALAPEGQPQADAEKGR